MTIMADLVIERLAKEYPTRAESLKVLQEISLSLSQGESAAILGPSGCGKSTLLYCIGTLEAPTSGSVTLDGQDPFALSETELARFRSENIGFIFQDHHLLPQLSVLENVLVPTLAVGKSTPQQIERAKMLIDRVGLSQRIEHRSGELSGGERQRVAVARSLIHQPKPGRAEGMSAGERKRVCAWHAWHHAFARLRRAVF